jgi:hypothetical protein
MPRREEERAGWLLGLASNEELTIRLMGLLGVPVTALDQDFPCALHQNGYQSRLARLPSDEIVYLDSSLSGRWRHGMTTPELAASLRAGTPTRLKPLASDVWHVRLLHNAGLVNLPLVTVPPLPDGEPEWVRLARNGFELLLRCKWFLYPDQPVSYSRAFVGQWCNLPTPENHRALDRLVRLRIITKVDEAESALGYRNQTALYLAGPGPATGSAS